MQTNSLPHAAHGKTLDEKITWVESLIADARGDQITWAAYGPSGVINVLAETSGSCSLEEAKGYLEALMEEKAEKDAAAGEQK